jgi:putative ABC transport system permease protein
MRVLRIITLAFKYFNLHKKRYLFLMVALSFGIGVITTLTSIKEGMEQNLYYAAQSHYAGDIVILGDDKRIKEKHRIPDSQKIIDLIEKIDLPIVKIIKRTQISKGTLYFNGAAVRQKYVFGVDWKEEIDYFDSIEYTAVAGNPFAPQSIMISSPVAQELSVQLGDMLTLEVQAKSGQINTGAFIVGGIIDDSSIFGYYKSYISRVELNNLIKYTKEQSSAIGLYLAQGASIENVADILYKSLNDELKMAPLLKNRDELSRERKKSWTGVKYFILTLPVYLSEVSELLLAIELISYFLYILMILIIIVSVLVTYRLILHEREKEIGTMRAIAFTQGEIISLLMMEAFILFLLSLFIGFFMARITIFGISFFPLNWMPSIEIFMKNGKITAIYSWRTTLINSGIVLISLLPAVFWPVYNASKQPLAVVLTGGNK